MIVHRPADGQPLVVTQDFHLNLAGQFAHAWGNDDFAWPGPTTILEYMARNHDAGWPEFDWDPPISPEDGLPHSVVTAAPHDLVPVHRRNIARNYAFHPYAGLLSAMHIKGFFTSRLGMSTFVVIDEWRALHPEIIEPLIAECDERIAAWTAEVAGNPETAAWVEPDRLWANYRLLQIFDQLSLYFCLGRTSEEVTLTNAPAGERESVDLVIRPLGAGAFSLAPYPLDRTPLRVVLDAKSVRPPMRSPREDLLTAPTRQLEFEVRAAA